MLDKLRKTTVSNGTLEWLQVKDSERTPVLVTPTHKSEDLLSLYDDLVSEHREYEKKVNYYKAKINNLVSNENSRIAKDNSEKQRVVDAKNVTLRREYNTKYAEFDDRRNQANTLFEKQRYDDKLAVSELKISVPARFKTLVDDILNK